MQRLFLVGLFFILPIATFVAGYNFAQGKVIYVQPDAQIAQVKMEKKIGQVAGVVMIKPTPTPTSLLQKTEKAADKHAEVVVRTGEEGLWAVVNLYRREHGLAPFTKDATLCGFSETRLGQVQSAGSLNHEGFQSLLDVYIKQGYTKISENLAQGFGNPQEIISSWDGSNGHRALLQGGDLDRGCSSEGGGFTVLIAGKK